MTTRSILTQTGRNLRQTWGSQFMTLLTVSLSVLIFSFFFLVYINLERAGARLGDEIRIVIFLDDEVPAAAQPPLEKKIRAFGGVDKVRFLTRRDAFELLGRRLGHDRDLLAGLDPGFLPPSIEVYPSRTLGSLIRIKAFADFLATLPGAVKVKYGRKWIERLAYTTQLVRIIVIMSAALLLLTATFMVASTIRLTVVSRRDEIEILRLMGADRGYIQTPLLIEGILQGVLGSIIGMGLLFALYRWITMHFTGSTAGGIFRFSFMPPVMAAGIVIASILLCTIGSMISIRKFLRL